MPSPLMLAQKIDDAVASRFNAYLIGIAGIPGSGKSTIGKELARLRPDAMIISMDGYHLPRSQLGAEQLRRRGTLNTFDFLTFRKDIQQLHENHCGYFPSFDHAEKDPRPDAVHVHADCPLVIVEGLYVLMRTWQCEHRRRSTTS